MILVGQAGLFPTHIQNNFLTQSCDWRKGPFFSHPQLHNLQSHRLVTPQVAVILAGYRSGMSVLNLALTPICICPPLSHSISSVLPPHLLPDLAPQKSPMLAAPPKLPTMLWVSFRSCEVEGLFPTVSWHTSKMSKRTSVSLQGCKPPALVSPTPSWRSQSGCCPLSAGHSSLTLLCLQLPCGWPA